MCWYVLMLNHCLVEPLLMTWSSSGSHFISSFDFHCCSSMNYFKIQSQAFPYLWTHCSYFFPLVSQAFGRDQLKFRSSYSCNTFVYSRPRAPGPCCLLVLWRLICWVSTCQRNSVSAPVCLKCQNPDSCAADGFSDTANAAATEGCLWSWVESSPYHAGECQVLCSYSTYPSWSPSALVVRFPNRYEWWTITSLSTHISNLIGIFENANLCS